MTGNKYRCHAIVVAIAMTASEFYDSTGIDPCAADDGCGTEGYQVTHAHGTEDELLTWMPKKVFEESHIFVSDEIWIPDELMSSFVYHELPEALQEFIKPLCQVAFMLYNGIITDNPKKIEAIKKLIEAKQLFEQVLAEE